MKVSKQLADPATGWIHHADQSDPDEVLHLGAWFVDAPQRAPEDAQSTVRHRLVRRGDGRSTDVIQRNEPLAIETKRRTRQNLFRCSFDSKEKAGLRSSMQRRHEGPRRCAGMNRNQREACPFGLDVE